MIYKRIFSLWTITIFATLQAYSHPIHVLFFIDTLMSETKTVIINQILGLKEKGFKVSILAKKKSIHVNEELEKYLEKDIYWGTLEEFDTNTVDVILCQYGSLGKECAQCLQKSKRPKLVTFFRGSDITATSETRQGSYDLLFATGDLFLPVCAYYSYLLTILGCDPQKILVQASGIDCSMFKFRKKTPHINEPIQIISTSRLVGKKGLDDAIRAIALLIDEGYNIEYTIIGEGGKKESLISLAEELHIADKIRIVGHKSNQEVAQLLQQSHIFILPSVTSANGTQEGIPNAAKEAMATGLPVISTYHAGLRELIKHNESGLLVPERDVQTLAKSIKYLIRNPKKWYPLITEARKVIEEAYDAHFLNDLLAQRIEALVR